MSEASVEFKNLIYESANIILETKDFIDDKEVSQDYIEARLKYVGQQILQLMEKYNLEYLHTKALEEHFKD